VFFEDEKCSALQLRECWQGCSVAPFLLCELVKRHDCVLTAFHVFPVNLEMEKFDDHGEAADEIAFRRESTTQEWAGGAMKGLG
jgi:hypothetical protein